MTLPEGYQRAHRPQIGSMNFQLERDRTIVSTIHTTYSSSNSNACRIQYRRASLLPSTIYPSVQKPVGIIKFCSRRKTQEMQFLEGLIQRKRVFPSYTWAVLSMRSSASGAIPCRKLPEQGNASALVLHPFEQPHPWSYNTLRQLNPASIRIKRSVAEKIPLYYDSISSISSQQTVRAEASGVREGLKVAIIKRIKE